MSSLLINYILIFNVNIQREFRQYYIQTLFIFNYYLSSMVWVKLYRFWGLSVLAPTRR